ncbi:hypothetical protein WR25_00473 [Diploscapter pachys]|uniref:Uncharacterized protein n=1 Tax=Diploscapter pachys TaxID=2018661 RepID=A0A2A2JZ56_9BILA|nr:hypothetical protein WR25_00473 [Diploscapter pachys]
MALIYGVFSQGTAGARHSAISSGRSPSTRWPVGLRYPSSPVICCRTFSRNPCNPTPVRWRGCHHHAVGQVGRLLGIVGDQQDGNPRAFANRQQFILQLLAVQSVEGAEGFVQQQNARAGHQPPGDGHALGHAAG